MRISDWSSDVCSSDLATPEALEEAADSSRYAFAKVDVCDAQALRRAFAEHRPDAVMHLAAESHVDRSIDDAADFVRTNVVGTYTLLEVATAWWRELEGSARRAFRFHHISTDEVYGSLGADGLFTEETPYQPNSPYSASKAASDHFVRAWHHTYGLPVVTSNRSEEHTSELQSLMRISYAVFCLKKKINKSIQHILNNSQ